MKQFKNIFIFGIAVLLIVGAMIIQYARPTRTVDFRGEIHKVIISETGDVTLMAISIQGGDFLFKIDDGSKLKNDSGEKIEVEDLIEGALIDINYKKPIFREEKVHVVKNLTLFGK